MRIPPYWAKSACERAGEDGAARRFEAWGWSFESQAAAQEAASLRAQRVAEAVAKGGRPERYEYLDRPLREEIINAAIPNGSEEAVVTRNRYGALVLNSASVAFVDVDFPSPRGGCMASLLLALLPGARRRRAAVQEEATIAKVRTWFQQNPTRAGRLYRTAAGLRLLLTDQRYDPTADATHRLFELLGADPLYRKLTLKQESFRARLTPKPWRCGAGSPPHRYPRQGEPEERAFRTWQKAYEASCKGFATCRLLEVFGPRTPAEPFAGMIRLHDRFACRDGDLPLA